MRARPTTPEKPLVAPAVKLLREIPDLQTYKDMSFCLMPDTRLRIIIVDDAKDDLILVQRLLLQCKILNQISLFSSGKECVDYVKSSCKDGVVSMPEPSIIFLDLVMAQTSGLEVLRFLQTSDYARKCIVVMLSGLKDIKAINTGYQLGARTFLLKPITQDDIVHLVSMLSSQVRIEESEGGGYMLYWNERIVHNSDKPRISMAAV